MEPFGQRKWYRQPICERNKKGTAWELEKQISNSWASGSLKCHLTQKMGQHNKQCWKINGLKPTCIYLNNFILILDKNDLQITLLTGISVKVNGSWHLLG